MSVSIAIYEMLNSMGYLKNKNISTVAGHSLGEYSALVVNNSLSYDDALKLLIIRSRAMQESMPIGTGGMAAIIGSTETELINKMKKLKNIGKLFIANDNADGQIVVSGEMKVIDYLSENYKKMGIKKAIKLPVTAPFHCELIKKASEEFEEKIKDFKFNQFMYSMYSNVTAEKCNHEEIKSLLSKQIINKVRWRETILNMIRDGVDTFIEIGPGKVLTNLIKRSTDNVVSVSISNMKDLEKLEKIQ